MPHARQEIKTAFAQLLKQAKTKAGDNVHQHRNLPLFNKTLPAILVYAGDEESSIFNESPRELERVVSFRVQPMVETKNEADLDDELDEFAAQIEAAINIDDSLCGTVSDVFLSGTSEIEIDNSGEQPTGAIELTFTVTYHTCELPPPPNDDFGEAGIDWDVQQTADNPDAVDTVEIPTE